jgi:hypothetical protein
MIMEIEGEVLFGPDESDDAPTQQADQTNTEPKGTYEGKTVAQWREMVRDSDQRRQESIERSDTDGCLTQWTHDSMARKYTLCATLAEREGIWEFQALFDLEGNLVPDATYVRTRQRKWVWRIGRGQGARWFNESQARSGARRQANDRLKGYQVGTVRRRAVVRSGSSGRTSVYHYIAEVPDGAIEIVDNGSLGTQYEDRS